MPPGRPKGSKKIAKDEKTEKVSETPKKRGRTPKKTVEKKPGKKAKTVKAEEIMEEEAVETKPEETKPEEQMEEETKETKEERIETSEEPIDSKVKETEKKVEETETKKEIDNKVNETMETKGEETHDSKVEETSDPKMEETSDSKMEIIVPEKLEELSETKEEIVDDKPKHEDDEAVNMDDCEILRPQIDTNVSETHNPLSGKRKIPEDLLRKIEQRVTSNKNSIPTHLTQENGSSHEENLQTTPKVSIFDRLSKRFGPSPPPVQSESISIIEPAPETSKTEETKEVPTTTPTISPTVSNKQDLNDATQAVDYEAVEQPIVEIPENATQTLHITGLKRPFTNSELIEMLQSLSPFDEKTGFWLSSNKSDCLVTYDNLQNAATSYFKLNGMCWPTPALKLSVEFTTKTKEEYQTLIKAPVRIATTKPTSPVSHLPPKPEPKVKTIDPDKLFLKTQAQPSIFYLPLTEEKIQEMKTKSRNPEQAIRSHKHR